MRCKAIFLFCGTSLFWFWDCNSRNPIQKHVFRKRHTHKTYKTNQTETRPLQNVQHFSKILQKLRIHWTELLWILRWFFAFGCCCCCWCCNIITSPSSWSSRLSSFRVSQNEASPARVREVKRYFQIPINLVSSVLCAYPPTIPLESPCTYIPICISVSVIVQHVHASKNRCWSNKLCNSVRIICEIISS